MTTPMTLFAATVTGVHNNNHYPNKHTVTDVASLAAAVAFDHVAATYVNDRRSSAAFMASDCVVMDIDNDHTESQTDWITPEKLGELISGVEFMTATSRNHMKPKGVLSARPRFHVYFPIHELRDADEYTGLKHRLAGRFGFFDRNALDAGRFIYGTTSPQVTTHSGGKLLDDWLDEMDEQDVFAAFDQSTLAIGEGSRNATLSRFAGRVLIRYGQTDQARGLFEKKASLCEPPLSDGELRTIWNSACRFATKVASQPDYVPPDQFEDLMSLRPTDFTDIGQASVFAAEYAHRVCFSTATKWLAYHEGAWRESEPKAHRAAQQLTDRQLEDSLLAVGQARKDLNAIGVGQLIDTGLTRNRLLKEMSKDQREVFAVFEDAQAWHKFVLKYRNNSRIEAFRKEAEPLLEINPDSLDANPYLLNTPTATFDLRDGSRREHDPADFITKQTSLDPSSEGMDVWLAALDTIFQGDQELIDYVQRVCGLAAIGKVMIEALIIAYGNGANGKSTFWNTVSKVLGSYAGSIAAEVLIAGRKSNAKNDMAETRGLRFLIAAETEEGARLSTASTKQLASTDKIAAEKKFKDPFAFTPTHTLVLYTNHLPKVGARDTGIWRRLIVIPFNAKIEGSQDIKNYADQLYEQAGGAVLAWIMEGARLIHAENYQLETPRSVKSASEEYRAANDWFAQFLDECCEVNPGLSEKSGQLYSAYRAWALARGDYTRSTTDFAVALEKAGHTKNRTNKGVRVAGLRLKNEFEQGE
ncbi:phage/plasmid primase, P4 family [Gleimia hominis]|uniref:Phage/plasmid primase, P4 family n=1 Tax=Gleimia hominis TaxID=595468 RepID=A0ABU3ICT9_9ACTO|nr:phage/plasmid primase, P4 family [Gleimia hominis]MDT3768194.1 phage/plasmid primase, P4 family [Gleimia hominis]